MLSVDAGYLFGDCATGLRKRSRMRRSVLAGRAVAGWSSGNSVGDAVAYRGCRVVGKLAEPGFFTRGGGLHGISREERVTGHPFLAAQVVIVRLGCPAVGELAEEGAELEGLVGDRVFFNREPDLKGGHGVGAAQSGEALAQTARAGEEVDDGDGDHAGALSRGRRRNARGGSGASRNAAWWRRRGGWRRRGRGRLHG